MCARTGNDIQVVSIGRGSTVTRLESGPTATEASVSATEGSSNTDISEREHELAPASPDKQETAAKETDISVAAEGETVISVAAEGSSSTSRPFHGDESASAPSDVEIRLEKLLHENQRRNRRVSFACDSPGLCGGIFVVR